jgi:hypothetical protein
MGRAGVKRSRELFSGNFPVCLNRVVPDNLDVVQSRRWRCPMAARVKAFLVCFRIEALQPLKMRPTVVLRWASSRAAIRGKSTPAGELLQWPKLPAERKRSTSLLIDALNSILQTWSRPSRSRFCWPIDCTNVSGVACHSPLLLACEPACKSRWHSSTIAHRHAVGKFQSHAPGPTIDG